MDKIWPYYANRLHNSCKFIEYVGLFDFFITRCAGVKNIMINEKKMDKIWKNGGYCRIVAPHDIVLTQNGTVANILKFVGQIIHFDCAGGHIQ